MLCALPVHSDTSSSKNNLSCARLTLYQRRTSLFSDLPAGSLGSLDEAASAFQKAKWHCHIRSDLNFCRATSKSEVKPGKNKNHDTALKTSALNTQHTVLSTIIPLTPNPPYLMRTHVKNSPVGAIHFRARISARPDPALRAASVPKGKLCPIASVSGAWAPVVFSRHILCMD